MEKQLLELAMQFRVGIEKMDKSQIKFYKWFKQFPKGCCGNTSDLLAYFLMKHDIKAKYVTGIWRGVSHGWLEYDGYIIDITADQFKEIHKNVIVTRDDTWHSKFHSKKERYNNIENYKTWSNESLMDIYEMIERKIT